MQILLKYTYLMEVEKIKLELERLWKRYQEILDKPNWEDMNEARSILYLTGNIYCEKVAPEAIERRLHFLKNPINLLEFLTLVDSNSERLTLYRKDPLFSTLEKYYRVIKEYKNKFIGGKHYLDEERFINLYNEFNPDKNLKMKERGKF